MSWDADGYRISPEKGCDAVADGALEKCVSGVIDVMCFISLIIPHSAETPERWLGGCTSSPKCVCVALFAQRTPLRQLSGALLSESDSRLDLTRLEMVVWLGCAQNSVSRWP